MERRPPQSAGTPEASGPAHPPPPAIHIHQHPPHSGWPLRVACALLLASLVLNGTQLASYRDYQAGTRPPYEQFVDGELGSRDKIALLEVEGVIMPPYTDRTIAIIKKIADDDDVKGVVLAIDSPGGLVADSHRIHQQLVKLREKKPIVVSMGSLAASGGYYVAMGAGPGAKIFAEETTWTGSIGVIIPRYDLSELGAKVGVQSDALKTGPLKDALDPFRPLTAEERQVWDAILDESLAEFIEVIDEGRESLTAEEIRGVATGQVFTSTQALKLKLIDAIGEQDAAIESLKSDLQLTEARIVRYSHPGGVLETLLGSQASSLGRESDPLSRLLEAGVPRAMYLFGWQSGLGRR